MMIPNKKFACHQDVGAPPGTVVCDVGEEKSKTKVKVEVFDYKGDYFNEVVLDSLDEIEKYKDHGTVTWVNFSGSHDAALLKKLGEVFNIHQLTLDDMANPNQRPKMEDHGDFLFIIVKMAYFNRKQELAFEQVSLIVTPGVVVTVQEEEEEEDVFSHLRKRIRESHKKVRTMGTDYLAYMIIDALIDNYFFLLENIGERIDEMEESLLGRPDKSLISDIHNLKRELIYIRRAAWPLREVVSAIQKSESDLITDAINLYTMDLYDHVIQVIDTLELYRDMASGMIDVYLSSISNRMNEVMKVLTVISTIFIPLTFIVGLYGMNFKFFPEINWRYGYAFVWAVMLGVVGIMMWFFKKKGWMK